MSRAARGGGLPVVQSVRCWLAVTENWIYRQVVSLPGWIDCHVVCETAANLDCYRVARLHVLDQQPWWRAAGDRAIRKLGLRRHLGFLVDRARRCGAKVLHSHFGNVGWSNLGAARQAGLKHVVTFYGYDVNHLPAADARWKARYAELFAQADRILCEGSHMAACLAAQGCPPGKLRIQRLGIDADAIPFAPRRWDGRAPLRVLIAGTFTEKKGIPDALEAVAGLAKTLPVAVTLIGDAHPQDALQAEKRRILDTIERFRLGPVVRRLGYVPHERWLAEAYEHDVLLAPSLTARSGDTEGGLPVGLLEAAASGMPVVSTAHCDIPEAIVHRVTGLLAPEGDAVALAEELRWLVEHRQQWPAMLEASRARIETEYHAARQAARLADLYAEVSGGP